MQSVCPCICLCVCVSQTVVVWVASSTSRDRIRKDLKLFHIDEGGWYVMGQNKDEWR